MENKTELILIRISGLDRPGLTASITAILSEYDVDIMDIGQADIHSTLSLGLLFKCKEKDSGNIMKDLHPDVRQETVTERNDEMDHL